jgi:hypothetical protein
MSGLSRWMQTTTTRWRSGMSTGAFEDEDVSEQYGSKANIRVITCPLAQIRHLKAAMMRTSSSRE